MGLTSAVEQLEGTLSRVVGAMRLELTELITRLEVMIDYPEEDLEDIAVPDCTGALQDMKKKLAAMLEDSHSGKMVRDGVMVAIAGTPNAGKSSLLNRLLQEDRAIVTDVPGTTRDVLEEWITIHSIPMCLVDTAGIRTTDDRVEKIGVDKARQYLQKADMILIVIDGSRPLTEEDRDILEKSRHKKCLIVLNKQDLNPLVHSDDVKEYGHTVITLSAETGQGLDALKKAMLQKVVDSGLNEGQSVLLTNTRHIELVRRSDEALDRAITTLENGMPLDCAIVDIREAWDLLGSITGDTVHDDIVTEIFSRFCLGK